MTPKCAQAPDDTTSLPVAELEAISPWFTVLDGVPDEPGRWEPIVELLADDARVDSLIARSAERLGTGDQVIAASVLQQGWAARLTSIWAGCIALRGWAPDLRHEYLRRRTDHPGGAAAIALTELHRLGPEAAWAALYHRNLVPLGEALRRRVRLGRRLLAGNVASDLAGTAMTLERQDVMTVAQFAAQPWANPPELRGLGSWVALDPPAFRRTSCCGYERMPGKPRCGDCSLTR